MAAMPISDSRAGKVRFRVLLMLCIAAMLAYLCRNTIGVAESTIRDDLHLTKEQTGLIMSAFMLPYALGQIPGAWLGEKWGARNCLPIISIIWSGATALMGLVTSMPALIFCRMLEGLSQAGLFPCSTLTLAKWFPVTGRAFASGALGSSMSLGAAFGTALGGYIVVKYGWRWMFFIFAAPGFLWAVYFYGWFRNAPKDHPSISRQELEEIALHSDRLESDPNQPTPWLRLLSSPATWLIFGQQVCRAAAQIFFFTWFPTFLQETRHVTVVKSGIYTMLPQLGLVAGGLIGGQIVDSIFQRTRSKRLSRNTVACVSLFLCSSAVLASYFIENNNGAIALITVSAFFAGLSGPCGYTITIDMGGRHIGSLFSSMNMMANLGAMAFPLLVPEILRRTGNNWNVVLALFAALFLIAAICWLLLDPDGTVFDQSLVKARTQ